MKFYLKGNYHIKILINTYNCLGIEKRNTEIELMAKIRIFQVSFTHRHLLT
jgi:hypothetical protein